MGRSLNRLSDKAVTSKQKAGLYCDGGGLYLQVSPKGNKTKVYKSWIFRFRSPITQKLRDMGLGPVHSVGLPDARERAAAQRSLLSQGTDPITARDEELSRKATEAAKAITFAQCAASYIESHRPRFRNEKHGDQWESTINTYCDLVIGSLPVQVVDTGLVLKILEPIWASKPETASRLRGRIENILDWAKARGYRSGENPALWRGHLSQLLPALATKSRVTHHKAMPFSEVGGFVAKLREMPGIAARCLEFVILTASRTNEAIKARPDEFNLDNATWMVPASRMKAGREHRVPLSHRAVAVVREMMQQKTEYLFPGMRRGKPICNMAMLVLLDRMEVDTTVHGFRSSFRDWAAERTNFPHEVCEMSLAHTINNQAEAAYRRGDLFEKRGKLMSAWADYINTPQAKAEVVPFRSVVKTTQAA